MLGCYYLKIKSFRDDVNRCDNDFVYVYIDKQSNPTHLVVRKARGNGDVVSLSKLHYFCHDSGMISFDLCAFEDGRESSCLRPHAQQHFKIIRDIYHQHIWTNGDFDVFPIEADDPKIAADKIWDQFSIKLFVDYPRFIHESIVRNKDFKLTYRWKDTIELCHKAAGESMYALALAEHTNNVETHKRAAQAGIDSFHNIAMNIKRKFDFSILLRGMAINLLVLFFAVATMFPMANILFQRWYDPNDIVAFNLPRHLVYSMLATVGIAALIFGFYFVFRKKIFR